MKRERTLHRRSPKTWIECMCLLSQLITLYRGHGLTLYTTHTRSSGKRWDVTSNCSSFWNSEWISCAIPQNLMAWVARYYPNSRGKETLSLTLYTSVVRRAKSNSIKYERHETIRTEDAGPAFLLYGHLCLRMWASLHCCISSSGLKQIMSKNAEMNNKAPEYSIIMAHTHTYRGWRLCSGTLHTSFSSLVCCPVKQTENTHLPWDQFLPFEIVW